MNPRTVLECPGGVRTPFGTHPSRRQASEMCGVPIRDIGARVEGDLYIWVALE